MNSLNCFSQKPHTVFTDTLSCTASLFNLHCVLQHHLLGEASVHGSRVEKGTNMVQMIFGFQCRGKNNSERFRLEKVKLHQTFHSYLQKSHIHTDVKVKNVSFNFIKVSISLSEWKKDGCTARARLHSIVTKSCVEIKISFYRSTLFVVSVAAFTKINPKIFIYLTLWIISKIWMQLNHWQAAEKMWLYS